MKAVVVGASGTIGKAVTELLNKEGHEVVESSRHIEPRVNIDRPETIDDFYGKIGPVDAIICAAYVLPETPVSETSRI